MPAIDLLTLLAITMTLFLMLASKYDGAYCYSQAHHQPGGPVCL